MVKKYLEPEIDITLFEKNDVIRTSDGNVDLPDDEEF